MAAEYPTHPSEDRRWPQFASPEASPLISLQHIPFHSSLLLEDSHTWQMAYWIRSSISMISEHLVIQTATATMEAG